MTPLALVNREAVHRFESVEAVDDRFDLADRQPQQRGEFVLVLLETLPPAEEPHGGLLCTGEDVLIVHRSMEWSSSRVGRSAGSRSRRSGPAPQNLAWKARFTATGS
jgi:hypothetical protein